MSGQEGQLISSDDSLKSDSLSWEQVKKRDARRSIAWEFVTAGCQWGDQLTETRVKAL